MPQPTEHTGKLDDLSKEVPRKKTTEVDPGEDALHEMPEDPGSESAFLSAATPPHQLPHDLRLCLKAIIYLLENHTWPSRALKARWEEQHNLICSPEDVLIDYVRRLPPIVCHRLLVSASLIS